MRDIFVGAAYFNSHPHEEDDFIRRSLLGTFIYFNSHPHEEDDVVASFVVTAATHFNSHPHEEDDQWYELYQQSMLFQLTSSRRG